MWHKPIDPNLNQFTNSCKLLANRNALCRIEWEVPMKARVSDLGVGPMDSLTPGLTRRTSHMPARMDWLPQGIRFRSVCPIVVNCITHSTLVYMVHQTRPIRIYIRVCATYEGVINLISLSSTSQRMSLGRYVCFSVDWLFEIHFMLNLCLQQVACSCRPVEAC